MMLRKAVIPGSTAVMTISPLTVDRTCREVRAKCVIGKPVTPHSLRQAFAVHLEAAPTCVPSDCRSAMANLSTTAQYLRIATSKVCATASLVDALHTATTAAPDLVPA
jgi:site-specific recombinase XerD